jgi:hypothetical protein
MILKAAVTAIIMGTAAGAVVPGERGGQEIAAAWAGLSPDQRQMIDLVASDIWATEKRERPVDYRDLGVQQRNMLREEAMDRLGFEPRPVSGVEA